jgi:hypothetical protein
MVNINSHYVDHSTCAHCSADSYAQDINGKFA